jgi:hypothetical protein
MLTTNSHVHETVQPVIQKEVVQPEIIHTAVPVHEVHHNAARIHPTATREAVSMDEYKKKGGALSGTSTKDAFMGCPQGKGSHESSSSGTQGSSGTMQQESSSTMSSSGTSDPGMSASKTSTTNTGSNTGLGSSSSTTEKKPSLMDRLNPYKDADNDGKKGFLS